MKRKLNYKPYLNSTANVNRNKTGTEQEQYRNGAGTEQERNRNETGTEQSRNRNGTNWSFPLNLSKTLDK
jgi:hypothetical protein